MNYNELLQQPQWLAKRREILTRDFNRCRNCASRDSLQVHHRQYHLKSDGSKVLPWNYESKYLITLCETCHKRGHDEFKVPIYPIEKTENISDKQSTLNTNQIKTLTTQL